MLKYTIASRGLGHAMWSFDYYTMGAALIRLLRILRPSRLRGPAPAASKQARYRSHDYRRVAETMPDETKKHTTVDFPAGVRLLRATLWRARARARKLRSIYHNGREPPFGFSSLSGIEEE